MEFKRHLALGILLMPFFISGVKSKNNLRSYVAFLGITSKKYFFCNLMILNYWWFVLFFHINFSDM